MNMFFSVELIAGVLSGLVIATVIMLVLQIRNATMINKLTFPAYEYVVKQAEHKANEIIASAQKEARAIISSAEQAGQKTIVQYTQKASQLQEHYEVTLQKLVSELSGKMVQTAEQSGVQVDAALAAMAATLTLREANLISQFDTSLVSVEKMLATLQTHTTATLTHMESDIAELSRKLGESLTKEDSQQQERIAVQLQKLQDNAAAQIEEYQKARMALLDAHIERLVEDIVMRVLHKKLSVDEHAQLAREALVEAKAHNLL